MQPRNRGYGHGIGLYKQQGLQAMFETADWQWCGMGQIYGVGPGVLPLVDPKILEAFNQFYV